MRAIPASHLTFCKNLHMRQPHPAVSTAYLNPFYGSGDEGWFPEARKHIAVAELPQRASTSQRTEELPHRSALSPRRSRVIAIDHRLRFCAENVWSRASVDHAQQKCGLPAFKFSE